MKKERKISCLTKMWAELLKKVAPEYCVRKKTLKNNPNAELYLPGVEKELKVAQNKLSNDEISKHVWSYETRLKLLKSGGGTSLIPTITTFKELEVIFKLSSDEAKLKALEVYTPKKDFILKRVMTQSKDFIQKAVVRVPTAFQSLTPLEFTSGDNWDWDVCLALAKADKTGRWAEAFVKSILKGQMSEDAIGNFNEFIEITIKKGRNLDWIALMCHTDAYRHAVRYVGENGDKKLLCLRFFPLMSKLRCLTKAFTNIETIGYNISDDDAEGFVWLKIGYDNLDKELVFAKFLSKLESLKAVTQPELYQQIINKMVKVCPSLNFARELMSKEPTVNDQDLYETLFKSGSLDQLLKAFPYAGWNTEIAKKTISALALEKWFPVSRMDELSTELQDFAKSELEYVAQRAAITSNSLRASAVKMKLQPKAEVLLFTCYFDAPCVIEYVTNNKMEEDSFYSLVCRAEIMDFNGVCEAVGVHAKTWGVTEKQYLWLLQSPFAGICATIKKYVK